MIDKMIAIISHPVVEIVLICLIVAFIVVSTIENIIVIDMDDDVDMAQNIEGWEGSSKQYIPNLHMKKNEMYIGNQNNMDRVNRSGYDASGDPAEAVGEYSVYARKHGERYNRYHSVGDMGENPRAFTTVGHKMTWTSSTRKPWGYWWMSQRGMAYSRPDGNRKMRKWKYGYHWKNAKVCRWVREGFVGMAGNVSDDADDDDEVEGDTEGFVEGARGRRASRRASRPASRQGRVHDRIPSRSIPRRVTRRRIRVCEVKRVRRLGWHITYVPKYRYYWKQHRLDYTNASHTLDESNFNTLSSSEANELKTKLRGVGSQLSTSGSVVKTNTTRINSIAPTVNQIKKDVDMISGLPKMVKKGLSENGVWG